MKKIFALMCLVILILLCACGCNGGKMNDNGKLNVVVTAFPHYDIARQIGKDNINLTMLLKPGTEMHGYEPTPMDMSKISSCDIFIYTGGESDTWAKGILEAADNKDMIVIAFAEICEPVAYPHDGEEHSSHDGHNHEYDEHVWTSPVNAMKLSDAVLTAFCKKDSKNKDAYMGNHAVFHEELKNVDEEFASAVKNGVRKKIVVADRFPFMHLVNEYGIEFVSAFPGCSSQTEPSAATVANMSHMVEKENIPVVFTIEFSNKKIAKTVTEGKNTEILTLHSCHNVSKEEFDEGITYVELMTRNAQNLRKALG